MECWTSLQAWNTVALLLSSPLRESAYQILWHELFYFMVALHDQFALGFNRFNGMQMLFGVADLSKKECRNGCETKQDWISKRTADTVSAPVFQFKCKLCLKLNAGHSWSPYFQESSTSIRWSVMSQIVFLRSHKLSVILGWEDILGSC